MSQDKEASKLGGKQVAILLERTGRQWGISSGIPGIRVFEGSLPLAFFSRERGSEPEVVTATSEARTKGQA
jgi:hypothetical protein